MTTNDLYIGAPVIYKHKVYKITNIGIDKVGIVPWYCEKFHLSSNRYYDDIKFVRNSLIKPVPVSEIILYDTRFKPSELKIDKNTISGLSFNTSKFNLFICKDSKFIDTYRVFINSNDYCTRYYDDEGNAVPVMLCFPITYMHELMYILKKIHHNMNFNFIR